MKMKTIICLTAALTFAALFAACENPDSGTHNDNTDTPHVHQWKAPVVENAASCQAEGLETKVCALDATHIEHKVLPKLPHTYGDWEEWEPEDGGTGERIACAVCDITKDSKLTGGNWLTFTKINDDAEYRVSKVSADMPSGIIIIPAYYRETEDDEYLPVTQISNGATNSTTANAFGGNNAANATQIVVVTVPATVTSIANYAFYNCPLQDIFFAEGSQLESIGATAFRNCSSLGSIAIPEGVTSLGTGVFQNCTGLTDVTLPESLTTIPSSLFNACSSLISVDFPSSVTSIGSSVFQDCTSLISVTIPEGITSIPNSLFSGCTSLASITISKDVTSIGSTAFRNTGLTSVIIPANVTSIAAQAFTGCTKLELVTCLAETPPTLGGDNVFFDVYDYMEIKVPAASVEAYKTAAWWKLEADFISAIE